MQVKNKTAKQKELVTPRKLKEMLAPTAFTLNSIRKTRLAIQSIMDDQDDRLLVVIGPCSIHDPIAAKDYAMRLYREAESHKNELLVVMRTYIEKPRTAIGWKGFVSDPHLNNTYNMAEGIYQARALLLEIASTGIPIATEILNPTTAPYFEDLASFSVVGARTVESQMHREYASSLSMPVGFKNNTNGDIQAAIHGVLSAKQPHTFIASDEMGSPTVIHSQGNQNCHVILRGSRNHTNYDTETINQTAARLADYALKPKVMIDCSHGNCQKDHTKQSEVLTSLCHAMESGNQAIFGIMIESNLVAGNQSFSRKNELTYGQSITDPCIGWAETTRALSLISSAVKTRRQHYTNYGKLIQS